jgi:hypothetical protein
VDSNSTTSFPWYSIIPRHSSSGSEPGNARISSPFLLILVDDTIYSLETDLGGEAEVVLGSPDLRHFAL